ncbi:hypothetical protein BGX29_006361 [Mortierella sp. GBA35]|nr:hypothetical protein BGX29_006361 [Mortierella sp. GBA35]
MLIPEVVLSIASFCDPATYRSCIKVCRVWREVFTPFWWSTVDDSHYPWNRLLRPRRHENPKLFESPHLIHAEHIRHLVIAERWLLSAAISSNITNLESLVIVGLFGNSSYPGTKCLLDETPSIVTVPATIFKAPMGNLTWLQKRRRLVRSQLCWHLVFNNPHLQSIEFRHARADRILTFKSTAMDQETDSYLLEAFSALKQLQHFDIGNKVDGFVLPRLGILFPRIATYNCRAARLDELSNLAFSTCTTLRNLVMHISIRPIHLRSIVKAFSGLQRLTLRQCIVRGSLGTNPTLSDEIIHNTSIETLVAERFSDISATRIRLNGLRKLTLASTDHQQLRATLDVLPALEYLLLAIYTSHATDTNGDPDPETPEQGWPLRVFLCQRLHENPTVSRLLQSMPHLVRLHLGFVTAAVVAELGRTCRNLEWVRFDLRTECHAEMNQLFVGCSRLTHCMGMGHAILATDMIREPHWTCFRLQELHCAIRGVPRLSHLQEHILDRMRHESRTEPKTDKEREVVEKRTHSLSVQRQIYQRLAVHTDLAYLDIGFEGVSPGSLQERYVTLFQDGLCYRGSKAGAIPDSLELSLETGLSELAVLSGLRTIGFQSVDHRIGLEEMLWIVDNWSVRRVMGMQGYYVQQGDPDPQLEPRLQSFFKLFPPVA